MTSPAVAQPTPSSSKALPAEEGGDGGNRQVENIKKPPTSAFLTPEITSYFIGELRALSRTNDQADRRGLWGASGGMCRRSLAHGGEPTRAAQNYPVRTPGLDTRYTTLTL